MRIDAYKDFGDLSAVEPHAKIALHCDPCAVKWLGCMDAAACPQCGNTEAWDQLMRERGYYVMSKRNEQELHVEDNKGGDYLTIRALEGGQDCIVEVGHQCVVVLRHRMPVAMLTAALAHWHDAGEPLPWDDKYNEELRARKQPVASIYADL